jgi:hypothetical protein
VRGDALSPKGVPPQRGGKEVPFQVRRSGTIARAGSEHAPPLRSASPPLPDSPKGDGGGGAGCIAKGRSTSSAPHGEGGRRSKRCLGDASPKPRRGRGGGTESIIAHRAPPPSAPPRCSAGTCQAVLYQAAKLTPRSLGGFSQRDPSPFFRG